MKISKDEINIRVNKLLGDIYNLRLELFSAETCGVILGNEKMLERQIESKKEILLRLYEHRDLGIDFNEESIR